MVIEVLVTSLPVWARNAIGPLPLVGVGVLVAVGVSVAVGVGVRVGVDDGVSVGVAVGVGVGVSVGDTPLPWSSRAWPVQKVGLADVVAVSVPVAPVAGKDLSASSNGDWPLKRRRSVMSDGCVSVTREFQVDQ